MKNTMCMALVVGVLPLSVACDSEKSAVELVCSAAEHCPEFSSGGQMALRRGVGCLHEKAGPEGKRLIESMEKMPAKQVHDMLMSKASEHGLAQCPGAQVLGIAHDPIEVAREVCSGMTDCSSESLEAFAKCVATKFDRAAPLVPEPWNEVMYRQNVEHYVTRQRAEAARAGKPLPDFCPNAKVWLKPAKLNLKGLSDDGKTLKPQFTCDGEDREPFAGVYDLPEASDAAFAMLSGEADAEKVHWFVPHAKFRGGKLHAFDDAAQNSEGTTSFLAPCPDAGTEQTYTFKMIVYDPKQLSSPMQTWTEARKALEGHVIQEHSSTLTYERTE